MYTPIYDFQVIDNPITSEPIASVIGPESVAARPEANGLGAMPRWGEMVDEGRDGVIWMHSLRSLR